MVRILGEELDLDAVRGQISRSPPIPFLSDDISSNLEPLAPLLNPLVCTSGNCDIDSQLVCVSPLSFPSVGCKPFPVSTGKWYYEVTLKTVGCVQIGWADTGNSEWGRG